MPKKAQAISIVIPVFNEEDYIKDCLDLIGKQTVLPDEVIVVDNGSTDRTVEIVKKYPFVRILHESKPSVLYARTKGYNSARSDIIARIDADTHLSIDWVKRAKKLFEDPNIYAVTGPTAIYDMPNPRVTRWLHDVLLKIAVFLGFHFLTGCNMAMRRSAWESVTNKTCNNLSFFEDIDLALHLEENGMAPTYSKQLWSSVSSRRFRDTPIQFIHYLRRYSRTFRMHHKRNIGVLYAELAYLSTYILSKPLFWFFDPVTRKFHIRYIFAKKPRRIDPMQGRINS